VICIRSIPNRKDVSEHIDFDLSYCYQIYFSKNKKINKNLYLAHTGTGQPGEDQYRQTVTAEIPPFYLEDQFNLPAIHNFPPNSSQLFVYTLEKRLNASIEKRFVTLSSDENVCIILTVATERYTSGKRFKR
jgi:hypothetical protein